MRINNNLMALNAHRYMSQANSKQSKSLEKLSSGLAINSAADNAAGLAISEKMRAQINGLDQAQANAQDGISMIQTAEGALQESENILQRMRELAVQSANDTNTAEDRGEIQKEIDQLSSEITRISESTEFNTKKLLDGSLSGKLHIGANEGQDLSVSINAMDADTLGVAGAEAAEFEQTVSISTAGTPDATFSDGTYNVVDISAYEGTDLVDANVYGNDATAVTHVLVDDSGEAVGTSSDGLTFYAHDGADVQTNTPDSFTLDGDTSSVIISGTDATAEVDVADSSLETGTYTVADISNDAVYGGTYSFGLKDSEGEIVALGTIAGTAEGTLTNITDWVDVSDTSSTLLNHAANASFEDGSEISVTGEGIDVSSQEAASAAITTLNTAINDVSAERANLGSIQNRLDHTINNLSTTAENMTASESRIRDVDMAKEMMEYTKLGILQQASQAMLAQANQAPQGVLQLLQ